LGWIKFAYYRAAVVRAGGPAITLAGRLQGRHRRKSVNVKTLAILLFVLFVVLTLIGPFVGSTSSANIADGDDGLLESDEDLLARERAAHAHDDDA
jgi:hypothetical protein